MMTTTDLTRAANLIKERDVRFVRFTWTDNAGLIRAKAAHIGALGDNLQGLTLGVAMAQQALPSMYDALAPGSGLTPAGEVRLIPDWSTFQVLPFSPGQARVLVDLQDGDQPWTHCPRSFLRGMIARAAEQGLQLQAAFENEFYLLQPPTDGTEGLPRPVDRTVYAQTYALDRMAPMLDELGRALVDQGVQPESLNTESGGGQLELPVHYADALRAADQQIVLRETVHAVAHRHGLIASFLPKIYLDQGGNGAHLHLSLWRQGRNVTADAAEPTKVSSEAASFVAGLLAHLPALTAITTPTPNSFKRLRPRFWSGAYTCWGYGNREAAVRVPRPGGSTEPVTNLELKTVDPSCNPYLALGAVIAAGLDGLARALAPPEPVQLDPDDLPEDDRRARRIERLPDNLGQAIELLEGDVALGTALGDDLRRSFLAVRRAEWLALKDTPHDEEVSLLLERY